MIRYGTAKLASPLETPQQPPSSANSQRSGAIVSLTPLWEFVVKTKSLPNELDLDAFFLSIKERLRDPEKEVRQHALRVLRDFLPLIASEDVDRKMQVLLGDLVVNLGHAGPAIRRGSVDCLQAYLRLSSRSDAVFVSLVRDCLEHASENGVGKSVSAGVVTAAPQLVGTHLSHESVSYIIRVLLDKMVQLSHQEAVLASLVKIKNRLGEEKFEKYLKTCGSKSTKRDFDLLCEVYGFDGVAAPNGEDAGCTPSHRSRNRREHQVNPRLSDNKWNVGEADNSKPEEVIEDKVILETEIKLDSGPAITMQIHEESRQNVAEDNSDEEARNSLGIVKVLADESEEDFERRKTPRRVRFGGEVVKMRTPDSDSNHPSDADNEPAPIKTPIGDSPLVRSVPKSNIPVASSSSFRRNAPGVVHSEPSSPTKANKRAMFRSQPNLLMAVHVPNSESSKIPKRERTLSRTTTIQIKVREVSSGRGAGKVKGSAKEKGKVVPKSQSSSSLLIPIGKSATGDKKSKGRTSPIMPHKGIEMFHNLTRSPERRNSMDVVEGDVLNGKVLSEKLLESLPGVGEKRRVGTADKVLLGETSRIHRAINLSNRNVSTADQADHKRFIQRIDATNGDEVQFYDSFRVCSDRAGGITNYRRESPDNPTIPTPIPTNDSGECLTCSSSGSDGGSKLDTTSWEDMGVVEKDVIGRLNYKDDWKIRLRGLEELNDIFLDHPTRLDALETRTGSLLDFLFSTEQNDRLQIVSEGILKIVFANAKTETLQARLGQITTSLCRMGSPAGVRLSILLMRRISVQDFTAQLLSATNLVAKSSKIREGALQILMTIGRIFPSTEIDVPAATRSIVPLLRDRKKRVRRACLETVASLAQVGTRTAILTVISDASDEYPEREQLMRVVRARLSRKQLPAVDLNGTIRYSTPSEESELDWISFGSATPSPSDLDKNEVDGKLHDPSLSNCISLDLVNFQNSESLSLKDESECSNDSIYKEDATKPNHGQSNLQIWAVDPWDASSPTSSLKLAGTNGTLRPVYLVQGERLQQSPPQRSPRGRSFSPPIKRTSESVQTDAEPPRFVEKKCLVQKSFSSEHLKGHCSPSTSSTSSASTTHRHSSVWHGRSTAGVFKSGIPIPVSSELGGGAATGTGRFRLRTTPRPCETSRGPLSIPTHLYLSPAARLKSSGSGGGGGLRNNNPDAAVSTRSVFVRQPFSTGTVPNSPDFYTPPAEPHLSDGSYSESVEDVPEEKITPLSFIEVGTPRYHNANFTVLDDGSPTVLDRNENSEEDHSSDPIDNGDLLLESAGHTPEKSPRREDTMEEHEDPPISFDTNDAAKEPERDTPKRGSISNSLDDLHQIRDTPRSLAQGSAAFSRSEVNLQTTHQIFRKSVNSAPPINDSPSITFHHNVRHELLLRRRQDEDDDHEDDHGSPESLLDSHAETTVSIPGSVVVVESTVLKSSSSSRKNPFVRKGSVRGSRRGFCDGGGTANFPGDDPRPFVKPKEGLSETLSALESPEWETTMRGLLGVVRLTRNHPEVIEMNAHTVCVPLGRQIKNLRSQVARAACIATSELFRNHRKGLEMELEELVVPLLHRTADTNKFLRADANMALDEMCLHVAPPRAVTVLTTKGGGHHNALVRCTAARLLCSLTARLGAEKTFQLPKDTRDKILCAGANMLLEGNLDTRKHAKMMLGNLSVHSQFNKAMAEAVPICTMRHIQKTLKTLQ